MYRPIPLDSLHTLMFGGTYNHRLLLKLVIQYITTVDIDNASEISNDEIINPPEYKSFL